MMLYSRLTAAFLCGVVLLSLAACSDPGGVGADVGREVRRLRALTSVLRHAMRDEMTGALALYDQTTVPSVVFIP